MLRVPVEAVYGVELVTAHRVIVKFVGEEEYRDFLRRNEGRSLQLPDGAGSVTISDRSGALTYVSVHGAPLEFPENLLRRFFGRYGVVISVRVNKLSSGKYAGKQTNVRTLGMRLRSDIPSSVRLLGYYVLVYYARQPHTCFRCGQLGHQAAGCSETPAAPVNLFREEDFPPLPQGVDSGDEVEQVPVAADAAPPASPDVPPVLVAPQPSASASSSTPAAVPGPAPSPGVPAVLGVGGAAEHPVVCGPVPHVVEAAEVLRRALVRPVREGRGSGSASGCEDVRPVPKRSRRSSTAWADMKDYDAGGASGDGVAIPGASCSTTLVVADVHVSAVDDDCASNLPPVLSPAEGSPQWEVVAPTGVDPGTSRGIKLVLKKDAKRGGSQQVQRSVVAEEPCEAAEEAPSVLPIARPLGKEPLPLILASGVAMDADDHPLNFEIVDRVRPAPWCPSTIWIRRAKCFIVGVPELMPDPRTLNSDHVSEDIMLLWEAYCIRFPAEEWPDKYEIFL
ncbi:uncharacterized protein [Procambarus clarkii]|uniref:uncharacterized protein n=1 Tax=Procambarus clarkii TaxID=6728 RepID=UPI003743D2A4